MRSLFGSILIVTFVVLLATADDQPAKPDTHGKNNEKGEKAQPEKEDNDELQTWLQKLNEKIDALKESIKKNWMEQDQERLKENLESLKELGERKLESLGIITEATPSSKTIDPSNYTVRQFKVEHPEQYTILKIEPDENFYMHSQDQRKWYRKPQGNRLEDGIERKPKGPSNRWWDFRNYFTPEKTN